jgi:hypothetical protein
MYIGPITITHAKYASTMKYVGNGVSINAKFFALGSAKEKKNHQMVFPK